ncbi:PREDICTED: fatty-acid amide hydrolase 1-like [Priapulus caudatus]|uniref:Fatty-acid amide hydrolase 1-like n=1 Tax=Priapulus caudatus TaxID=37621 RepID=A0ABM1DPH6_PRICU|nr:PREDICTED: fatty-acid amide hydrolase 1-like [Priapulus caudatus]
MVSYGPMGRNVADVALAMKAICSEIMQDIDPLVIPISFREEIYESKRALRIGYFDDNGHVTPTPSCKRAVHLSKEILERQGHELVPFNLPRGGEYGMMLSLRILNADDGRTLLDCWKDEDVDDTVKGVYFLSNLSSKIKAVVGRLLKFVYPRFGTLALQSIGCNDVHTLWKYYNERQLYIDEVMAAWKTAKLDALICPAFSYPALPYGFAHDMLYGATYTVVFNLLDFPAGIVPVTMETKEDQKALDNYPRTDLWDRKIVEATRGATGMPVGVQCVTLPWKEEQCLRVMGDIEAGLDN